MKDNFVFKSLSIESDHYNDIINQLCDYIDPQNLAPHTVQEFHIGPITEHCPSLIEYLNSLKCGEIYHMIILYTHPSNQSDPGAHIDYTYPDHSVGSDHYLSLNFPLKNCLYTPVNYYKPRGHFIMKNRSPATRLMPLWAINSNWGLLGSYYLTGPMLVNTNQWHSVINRTTEIRQSFCIRFKTDPWHLI